MEVQEEEASKEHNYLRLSSDKAWAYLNWQAVLDLDTSLEMTANWYQNTQLPENELYHLAVTQIHDYLALYSPKLSYLSTGSLRIFEHPNSYSMKNRPITVYLADPRHNYQGRDVHRCYATWDCLYEGRAGSEPPGSQFPNFCLP